MTIHKMISAWYWMIPFASILNMEINAVITWLNSAESSKRHKDKIVGLVVRVFTGEKELYYLKPNGTNGFTGHPFNTCLQKLCEDVRDSGQGLTRRKSREFFDSLPPNLKLPKQSVWRLASHRMPPTACKSQCTYGYILILTQIKLCIDGSVRQLWKTAEKLGNELCS